MGQNDHAFASMLLVHPALMRMLRVTQAVSHSDCKVLNAGYCRLWWMLRRL